MTNNIKCNYNQFLQISQIKKLYINQMVNYLQCEFVKLNKKRCQRKTNSSKGNKVYCWQHAKIKTPVKKGITFAEGTKEKDADYNLKDYSREFI